MGELYLLNCQTCGRSLKIEGRNSLDLYLRCPSCGNLYVRERDVVSLNGDSDVEMLRRGITHLKLNNFHEAEKVFENMTNRYPENYKGWLGRWLCLWKGHWREDFYRNEVGKPFKVNTLATATPQVKSKLGEMYFKDASAIEYLLSERSKKEEFIKAYNVRSMNIEQEKRQIADEIRQKNITATELAKNNADQKRKEIRQKRKEIQKLKMKRFGLGAIAAFLALLALGAVIGIPSVAGKVIAGFVGYVVVTIYCLAIFDSSSTGKKRSVGKKIADEIRENEHDITRGHSDYERYLKDMRRFKEGDPYKAGTEGASLYEARVQSLADQLKTQQMLAQKAEKEIEEIDYEIKCYNMGQDLDYYMSILSE